MPPRAAVAKRAAAPAAPVRAASQTLKPFDTARRLRPIYELVDNGQFKPALKMITDLVTMYGPHPTLLILSLLCATHLDDEAAVDHASARLSSVDPASLDRQDFHLWLFAVKRQPDSRWGDFLSAFDAAVALRKTDKEVGPQMLRQYYSVLTRVGDFAKQQQTAMSLSALTKAPEYSLWAATATLLLAQQQRRAAAAAGSAPDAPLPAAKLLQLSEMLIRKAYPDSAPMPPTAFDLLTRVILDQARASTDDDEAPVPASPAARAAAAGRVLALLRAKAGSLAVDEWGPVATAEFKGKLLAAAAAVPEGEGAAAATEAREELIKLAKERCEAEPDDWRWLVTYAYLTLGCHEACDADADAHPSALCGPFSEPLPALVRVAAPAPAARPAAVAALQSFFLALPGAVPAKAGGSPRARGPALACCEAARLWLAVEIAEATSKNSDAASKGEGLEGVARAAGALVAAVVSYFALIGTKPCFAADLAAYLDVLQRLPSTLPVAPVAAAAADALSSSGRTEAAAAASKAAAAPAPGATVGSLVMSVLAAEDSAAEALSAGRADASDSQVRRACALEAARLRLGCVAAMSDAALRAHAAALAARFAAYDAAPPPSAEAEALAAQLKKLNEERNHLELAIPEDTPAPRPTAADGLVLSAAAAFMELASRHGARAAAAAAAGDAAAATAASAEERNAVLDAVVLCEAAAASNKDNADARLWLSRLLSHPTLGAAGRARSFAAKGNLGVKEIQHESMAHLWGDDCRRWGRTAAAREVATKSGCFVTGHRGDDASFTSTAYTGNQFGKVLDFQEFRSRLERSHSFWSLAGSSTWDAAVATLALTLPAKDATAAAAAATAAAGALGTASAAQDSTVAAVLLRHTGSGGVQPVSVKAKLAALRGMLAENQDRGIVTCHAPVPAVSLAAAARVGGQYSLLASALNAPAPWPAADSFAALAGARPPLQQARALSRKLEAAYTEPEPTATGAVVLSLCVPAAVAALIKQQSTAADAAEARAAVADVVAALAGLGITVPSATVTPEAPEAASAAPEAPSAVPALSALPAPLAAALSARVWAAWVAVIEAGAAVTYAAAAAAPAAAAAGEQGWAAAHATRWATAAAAIARVGTALDAAGSAVCEALALPSLCSPTAVAAANNLISLPATALALLSTHWSGLAPAPKAARTAVKAAFAAAGAKLSATDETTVAVTALAPVRDAIVATAGVARKNIALVISALDDKVPAVETSYASSVPFFCVSKDEAASAVEMAKAVGADVTPENAPACGGATATAGVLKCLADDNAAARKETSTHAKAVLTYFRSFGLAK